MRPLVLRSSRAKRWTLASHLLAFICIFNSCAKHAAPAEEDSSATPNPCVDHDECNSQELCFADEFCSPPWGTYFELSECSLHGPGESDFAGCEVFCQWMNAESGAAQWNFSPQAWGKCVSENRIRAIQSLRAEVRCSTFAKSDEHTCPEGELTGSFCLSEDCPNFSIRHYRSEQVVELRNSQGYTLKFRMAYLPE